MAKTVFNRATVDPATAAKLGADLMAVASQFPVDTAQMKKLIERGANVDYRDLNNYTPLMKAAARGSAAAVEMLLDAGADKYAATKDGATALFLGIGIAHMGTLKVLLDAGVDPDKGVFKGGLSALMWAVNLGKGDIAEELVNAGAKVNRQHADGRTAADFAEKDFLKNRIVKLGQKQESDEQRRIAEEKDRAEKLAEAERVAAVMLAVDEGVNNHAEIPAPARAAFKKRVPVPEAG